MPSLLTKPLFLDANILLDWSFTNRSWAQIAVDLLVLRKSKLVTSAEAIQEAESQITKFVPVIFDNVVVQERFQQRLGFLPLEFVIDPQSKILSAFENVDATDQYLLRACKQHDLTLLTNDSPLRLACDAHQVAAATPIEILEEIQPSVHSLIGPSGERGQGSIVFCGVLSYFDTSTQDQFFEVMRVDDDLFLLANPAKKIWRLLVRDHETGEFLTVETKVAALNGNYCARKVGATWGGGKVHLIDFNTKNFDSCLLPNGLRTGRGILTFSSGSKFPNWPQLMISAAMRDNRPLGKSTRRMMRGTPWFVLPHPFDKDRLREALEGYLLAKRSILAAQQRWRPFG